MELYSLSVVTIQVNFVRYFSLFIIESFYFLHRSKEVGWVVRMVIRSPGFEVGTQDLARVGMLNPEVDLFLADIG